MSLNLKLEVAKNKMPANLACSTKNLTSSLWQFICFSNTKFFLTALIAIINSIVINFVSTEKVLNLYLYPLNVHDLSKLLSNAA